MPRTLKFEVGKDRLTRSTFCGHSKILPRNGSLASRFAPSSFVVCAMYERVVRLRCGYRP